MREQLNLPAQGDEKHPNNVSQNKNKKALIAGAKTKTEGNRDTKKHSEQRP